MNRIGFTDDDPRFNARIRLYGVGREEVMPPGFVSRRRGHRGALCVLFHDPVEVEVMGELIKVLPETMIFWDWNRPHHFGNAERSWSHSWVVFSGEDFDKDWLRAIFERPQRFEDPAYLLGCFSRLLREFESFDKPDLPVLSANIQLLLREMCREHEPEYRPGGARDPVKAARRWITENLRQSLPVSGVAKHAGLSPSRLQQLFRARLNCSVQQFIEKERLQEARYWLMHTGLRISEIAEHTGFSSAFYFTRRFTKTLGLSPSEYRKVHYGEAGKPDALPKEP
ncbi:MAG: helix-turn-helix domain-containing protein [Kiritimatiellales bacterium]